VFKGIVEDICYFASMLEQGFWEREAQIFKNLRERERFGSVFYIIHKNIYIYIYDAYIYIYIYI
jgi:hypothetical protein